MIKTKRIQQIKEYVFDRESASLDELVTHFGVSKNTIRRDVQVLVESGVLKKVYGGAAVNHSTLVVYQERKTRQLSKKQLIGKAAAAFVEHGDMIFVDSGTTTLEMLPYLKEKRITVVTNNVDFITQAMPYEHLTIFSTGGMLERKTNSFVGYQSVERLKAYNVNKAFIASTGLSIDHGVTNSSPLETDIKKTLVEKNAKTFLLVDDSKFDHYALTTFCDLKDIDIVVTNEEPNEDYLQYGKEHDVKFVSL
ncbi:DeoR/GlpR family DNA-binding transcription regulator [Bacillus aerius]|uniref:DeoR/GlpR family DNA-binding transcription regulator n=1 Tax=Bacillus aerius TaxID=293388 RepID=UPI002816312D|nr:DeoR/GlpR family DNA-binding transcription regulator [Bacillus aerius]WMT27610.1 DeoR/GlpR family DNA-binding transcription regulator [Bacillus aerius]